MGMLLMLLAGLPPPLGRGVVGEGCSGVCSRDRETAPRGQHPAGRWPWGALQARPLGAAPQQSPHSVGTRTISVKNIPLLS